MDATPEIEHATLSRSEADALATWLRGHHPVLPVLLGSSGVGASLRRD
jgi:hypothetical protein